MDYTPEQLRIIAQIHNNNQVKEEWQDIQKKLYREARDSGEYKATIGHIYPENVEKLRAAGFSVRSYPGSVPNCYTYIVDWSEDNG